jgi:Ran GTPase-activating protein (RanGAP) involved in mRNA processing and transport
MARTREVKKAKKAKKDKHKKIKCLQTIIALEKQANLGNPNKVVDLDLVRLEGRDIKLMIEALSNWRDKMHGENPRVRQLNLHFVNEAADSDLNTILKHTTNPEELRILRLACHKIAGESIKALAKMLRKCEKLKVLDLRHNSLGPAGMKELNDGRAFQFDEQSEGLRHLDLFFNLLGNKGMVCLASMLCGGLHKSMRVLNLDFNEIGAAGVQALSEILENGDMPYLIELSMANNVLKDKGAAILSETLKKGACIGLKKLNLAHNSITMSGSRAVSEAILSVRHWHHLLELDLSGNDFSIQTLRDLEEAVADGCIARPSLGECE